MGLRMPSATTRRDSSYLQFQRRVPTEVLRRASGQKYPLTMPAVGADPETSVVVTLAPLIKFSLRVRDPKEAKRRNTSLNEQLERIFEGVIRGPVDLDHKTTVALSGEVYRLFRQHWEKDPGLPEDWEAFKAYTFGAMEGLIVNPPPADWRTLMLDRHGALGDFGIASGPGLLDAIARLPPGDIAHSLEVRFGLLASWVLGKHGLEVTQASRLKLLRQVAQATLDAGWVNKRAAQGDYTPDPNANRFPPVENTSFTRVTFKALFDRWRRETNPAPSTVATWKPVLSSIEEHLQDDNAARLTSKDVLEWKDSLLHQGKSAQNVNSTQLACLHAMLSYGVRNGLLQKNAAAGIGVKQKRLAGKLMLPYEDAEVRELLAIAAGQSTAARRWIPFLATCSGARAGELAQLWAERVRNIDGIIAMELRPAEDGGTLKNASSERTVPIHPALIEAGFLSFVKAKGTGPLFYGKRSGKGGLHASKGTVNHLADWIRKQPGFDNPRKAPNHALRHWWKTTASRVGIPDSRADFLQGHTGQGEASRYRHFTLKLLADDIARIPIPPH